MLEAIVQHEDIGVKAFLYLFTDRPSVRGYTNVTRTKKKLGFVTSEICRLFRSPAQNQGQPRSSLISASQRRRPVSASAKCFGKIARHRRLPHATNADAAYADDRGR